MSLIAGEPHSAQLVALRDTELLRISRDGFEALIARHPRVMLNLMRMLVRRLHDTTQRPSATAPRPKTFAIVPLQDGLDDEPIAHRLAGALVDMGLKAAVLDRGAAEQTAEWFNAFEAAHDVVFYRGDAPDSPWTHQCSARRPTASSSWRAPTGRCRCAARAARVQGARLRACRTCCCCIPTAQQPTAGTFRAAQRIVRIPSPSPRRAHGRRAPARPLRCRARGRAGAGRRRRARLRPYRRHQGAGAKRACPSISSAAPAWAPSSRRAWRRMGHRGIDRAHARGLRRTQSAVGLHAAPDRAGARKQGLASCCAKISAKCASRNCRSRFSACRPISPRGASMSIATGPVAGAARQRGAAGHPAARHLSRPSAGRWRRDEQSAGGCDGARIRTGRSSPPTSPAKSTCRPATAAMASGRCGGCSASACAACRRSSRS